MAYLIKFKSDFTKGKWISQKSLQSTKAAAERMMKYLRKHDTDEHGKKIHLFVKSKKVDARKSPYNRRTVMNYQSLVRG
ncbi:MAG: hypothetical protein PHT07_15365 [Paludibacter sp.]|nr:hypothetical protein [Paludibacter sp.]